MSTQILKITCKQSDKVYIGHTTQKVSKYMKSVRTHIRHIKQGKRVPSRLRELSTELDVEILETTNKIIERKTYYMNLYSNCINDKSNIQ